MRMKKILVVLSLFFACLIITSSADAQGRGGMNWTNDGNGYYQTQGGELVMVTLPKSE